MTTLLLWRHAESSRDDPSIADHARPLTAEGAREAEMMAEHVRKSGVVPALVLCSSARRTQDTLTPLLPTLSGTSKVEIADDLYDAGAGTLLEQLQKIDPSVESVMVVGHNPTIHELALHLAGDGKRKPLERIAKRFPTGALATLDLGSASWSELDQGTCTLTAFVRPRDLDK